MHPGSKTVLNILHRFPSKENHSWKQKMGEMDWAIDDVSFDFFKWCFFFCACKVQI